MNTRMMFARAVAEAAMVVCLAGCDDAKRDAESIGIIGGADGPTAVWLTSPLFSCRQALKPDLLDCIVPIVLICPPSTIEDARDYLEKTVLNHPGMNGIDGLGPIKVELQYGRNLVVPLEGFVAANVSVRTVLASIAERDGAIAAWNPKRRVVAFLCKGKLGDEEWRKLMENAGEVINPVNILPIANRKNQTK